MTQWRQRTFHVKPLTVAASTHQLALEFARANGRTADQIRWIGPGHSFAGFEPPAPEVIGESPTVYVVNELAFEVWQELWDWSEWHGCGLHYVEPYEVLEPPQSLKEALAKVFGWRTFR